MDDITVLTAAGYLVIFLVCWYIMERAIGHFFDFLTPWVVTLLSGVLSALAVSRFVVGHVSF